MGGGERPQYPARHIFTASADEDVGLYRGDCLLYPGLAAIGAMDNGATAADGPDLVATREREDIV